MQQSQKWTWLVDHLAVDFANTVLWRDGKRVELVENPGDLAAWLDAEPAHLSDVDDITGELLERFISLRNAAINVLGAAVDRSPFPQRAVEHINAEIRATTVMCLLTSKPGSYDVGSPDAATQADRLIGALAAAVVDLMRRDDLANLALCRAPGCGQFFHRSRPNQRWCSPGCGNRARVDRHRHRLSPPS